MTDKTRLGLSPTPPPLSKDPVSFCLSFTPRFEMIAMVEWPTQSFPRKIGLIIDLVFGQSFIHSRCRGALSWPTTPLQESFRQRIHTLSELRELYHLSQEASS